MPDDTERPQASDPYRNFRFRLKWDGRYVAGVSKVSGLTRTTPVITHRTGGEPVTPRRMPGQSEYGPIVLERGITHDAAFQAWANQVWDYLGADDAGGGDGGVALPDFRKDVVLELYNEAGDRVLAYTIYRCWPSAFVALPELDGIGGAVAIQSLTLQNEGWQRDASVSPPPAPGA